MNLPPAEKIVKNILKIDRTFEVSVRMIDYVASNYPDFLNGKKEGQDILLKGNGINFWMDYFSNNFNGYRVFNTFGAFKLMKIFEERKGVRILEIGGGTGGAMEVLLDNLQKKVLKVDLRSMYFQMFHHFF